MRHLQREADVADNYTAQQESYKSGKSQAALVEVGVREC